MYGAEQLTQHIFNIGTTSEAAHQLYASTSQSIPVGLLAKIVRLWSTEGTSAVLSDMQNIWEQRETHHGRIPYTRINQLLGLIAHYYRAKCTDVRDLVYALLPLAGEKEASVIKPDYAKSTLAIFEDIMSLMQGDRSRWESCRMYRGLSNQYRSYLLDQDIDLRTAARLQYALQLGDQEAACNAIVNNCFDTEFEDGLIATVRMLETEGMFKLILL